ncbi:MAG: CD225/dispanin family protein [Bacteroidetes bacterium]|nr:CD225/dispanin family protein [Bacteroidota bacterium]
MENQKPPKSWLVESILVTILCCLPFGIAGIVNAAKVESRFHSGDKDGSERASSAAKKWTMIGFIIGLVAYVGYILLAILGIAGSLAGLGGDF